MKKIYAIGILIVYLLVFSFGCADKNVTPEPEPVPTPELNQTDKEVIGCSNSFAFNIFQKLNYYPYSDTNCQPERSLYLYIIGFHLSGDML